MSVKAACRRLRQEDQELKGTLGYTVRFCLWGRKKKFCNGLKGSLRAVLLKYEKITRQANWNSSSFKRKTGKKENCAF